MAVIVDDVDAVDAFRTRHFPSFKNIGNVENDALSNANAPVVDSNG